MHGVEVGWEVINVSECHLSVVASGEHVRDNSMRHGVVHAAWGIRAAIRSRHTASTFEARCLGRASAGRRPPSAC